jgi:cystathionine beta-lyase/cystathionine gamma-synthase
MSDEKSPDAAERHFETLTLHSGWLDEPNPRTVPTPIYAAANYRLSDPESHGGEGAYYYSRMANPTVVALEQSLAVLEGGANALAFASGMAGATVALSLLEAGDHLISSLDIYGGVKRLLSEQMPRRGISYDLVNVHDLAAVEAAIKPNTKMIWVDAMSNPMMLVVDVPALSEIAKRHNLLLGVDNTLCTPYNLNPLAHGADVVLHSATKYLGGHNDLFGGVAVMREEHFQPMHATRTMTGAILGPFDAYLVLRGLKTLAVRVDRMQENALACARMLEGHPRVKAILYPGLESHPSYALAQRQLRGCGSMITFGFEGTHADSVKVVDRFRVIVSTVSFGSVESVSEIPPAFTAEQCKMAAIPEGLTWVRLSIGLEHIDDLLADLEHALA